jgi:thiamine biosynthesis protein ThiI
MQLDETVILANYSEIALKGKNRPDFEKALVQNIRRLLGKSIHRIERKESRLIIHPRDVDEALHLLGNVFGITGYAKTFICSRKIEDIQGLLLGQEQLRGFTIKVDAARSDKSYPLTSPQINREIGKALEAAGFRINLKQPEKKITINILKKDALISLERMRGLGGLPVGATGKVLSLLSGGIDSPVASYLMMKRGCVVDYLHVHSSPRSKDVLSSKIPKTIEVLSRFHPAKIRLFIAPYTEFYKKSANIDPRIEMIIFRRFIFRLANRIARDHMHLGIVSGDNIGQVASQTLENLSAVNDASTIPIYRPLATFDKQEIIDLSKKIGTYDLSIEEYKDCCSLVAPRHPSTRVKPEAASKAEQEIGIGRIVEKTIEQMEVVEI